MSTETITNQPSNDGDCSAVRIWMRLQQLDAIKRAVIARGSVKSGCMFVFPDQTLEFAEIISEKTRLRDRCSHSRGFAEGHCRDCEASDLFVGQK